MALDAIGGTSEATINAGVVEPMNLVELLEPVCLRCGRHRDSIGPEVVRYACGHAEARSEYDQRKAALQAPAQRPTNGAVKDTAPAKSAVQIVSAADLLAREFPDPREAIPGILPEGLMLFGGKSKLGKSWFMLGNAIAVASGGYALGQVKVEAGDVLYLALEDGPRRVQGRLNNLLQGAPAPARLHVATEWPRLDEGGLDALDLWLAGHPEARLVVIDTLKRVRPRERHGAGVYGQDYDALAPAQGLAVRYGVAIVIIHHTNKGKWEDALDLISGSMGLTAAADGAMVLKRARGKAEAELAVVHRDLSDDRELALKRDTFTGGWLLVGDAVEHQRSTERNDVLRLLHDAPEPLTPKEVAEQLGKTRDAAKFLLWSMAKDGEVRADERGRYAPLVARPSDDSANVANRTNRLTTPEREETNPVSGVSAPTNRPVSPVSAPSGAANRNGHAPLEKNGLPVSRLVRLVGNATCTFCDKPASYLLDGHTPLCTEHHGQATRAGRT